MEVKNTTDTYFPKNIERISVNPIQPQAHIEQEDKEIQEKIKPYTRDYARLDKLRNNEYIRMVKIEAEIRYIKWFINDLRALEYANKQIG